MSLRRAKYRVEGSKRTKKIPAKRKKEGSKEIKLNIQDIKEKLQIKANISVYSQVIRQILSQTLK